MQNELGQGAYGTVYKGKWRNQQVAIKKLNGNVNKQQTDEFTCEAVLMR